MRRLIRGMIVVSALATPALAREECSYPSVGFPADGIELAQVTARKAAFYDEVEKPLRSFVLKGDELLADGKDGNFVCATYIDSKGVDTSGWLRLVDVRLRVPEPASAKAWMGDWTSGKYQNLTITPGSKPGWLAVSGSAYWAMSDEAAETGGLHEGSVEGEGPLENGTVGFTQTDDGSYKLYSETARDEYKCAIRLRLIGADYLLAEDSVSCGGANVSFQGYYARGKVEFDP
jgi:hypothetical protein